MCSDVLDDMNYEFIHICENYHLDISKFLLDMIPGKEIILILLNCF